MIFFITGSSKKPRHCGEPGNGETHHGYFNKTNKKVQLPLTNGVLNGTTKIAADKSFSTLPSSKPSSSTLPIRAPGHFNRDRIAPYSDPKSSKLDFAQHAYMPHAHRSKPAEEVDDGHSQSSKSTTSSTLKCTVNLDDVRHKAVISDPNNIPNIPRKDQMVTQSTNHNACFSQNIGKRTNVSYPGGEDHFGTDPSQSLLSKSLRLSCL